MLASKVTIGQLDQRIRIQEPVITDGSAGSDIVSSWADVVTVWASVTQRLGGESMEADRLTYNESTLFTIRYREGLNVRMRVVLGTFAYQIVSITQKYFDRHRGGERKGFLEIVGEIVDNDTIELESGFTTGFNTGYR